MVFEILKVSAISNIGNVRDNHEDNLFIPDKCFIGEELQKSIKSNDKNVVFNYEGKEGAFAVCDGMGGHNAGEVASRMAVEYINDNYNSLLTGDDNELIKFIKDLNNSICEYGEKNVDCSNMGSTFSSIIVNSDTIYLLHVGDSRVYKFSNNKLEQLSKDHTEGERLVAAGIVKRENLDKFPNRKLLYKYLGRSGELIADCEKIEVEVGTSFLIASDGLSDTISNDEIENILKKDSEAHSACKNLLEACLDKKEMCTDNVTIIIINIL